MFIGDARSGRLGNRAQADTPAFALLAGTNSGASFEGTQGWSFGYGAIAHGQQIAITQLGLYDSGGDGLVNAHQVGFWSSDSKSWRQIFVTTA